MPDNSLVNITAILHLTRLSLPLFYACACSSEWGLFGRCARSAFCRTPSHCRVRCKKSRLSSTQLTCRCSNSMLALTPQSGDSSGASLEVRSVALLHIAVFVALYYGNHPRNSPVVAVSLPCRCRN